jgi:hypothetical protein
MSHSRDTRSRYQRVLPTKQRSATRSPSPSEGPKRAISRRRQPGSGYRKLIDGGHRPVKFSPHFDPTRGRPGNLGRATSVATVDLRRRMAQRGFRPVHPFQPWRLVKCPAADLWVGRFPVPRMPPLWPLCDHVFLVSEDKRGSLGLADHPERRRRATMRAAPRGKECTAMRRLGWC